MVLGALTNIAIPLARDSLLGLLSNLNWSAINKFDLKLSWKRAVRVGIGFSLFILNEDMSDIIKIMEALIDSGVLVDEGIEIVKHEIKKARVWIS